MSEETNLLWLHWRVSIDTFHLAIHLLARCSIRSWRARLDLGGVHVTSVVFWRHGVARTDAVVWRRHGIVSRVALDVLGGDLSSRWRDALGCTARSRLPGVRGRFLARHDIDEEVEHIGLSERGGDIAALQGATFVLLCVDPGAHRELCDEDVASFSEQDWCFGRDHLHFRIRFHDFLDAG